MNINNRQDLRIMLKDNDRDVMIAKMELTRLRAMRVLCKNNDFGCEIHIGGIKAGVSMNERLLPVINAEIEEIQKFLKGKPNNYE